MSIYLRRVELKDAKALYALLRERKPWQAISHKCMPSWEQHVAFVQSEPYAAWYMILPYQQHANRSGHSAEPDPIGAIYLTRNNEIGIGIFNMYQGRGYGKLAVTEMLTKHNGPFLANINPINEPSRRFFEGLGFKFIQVTYKHD